MTARAAYRAYPASLAGTLAERRASAEQQELRRRLLAGDESLWPAPSVTRARLGWLALPETMPAHLAELRELAAEARAAGVRDVLVLGMGGSSLAAEVFAELLAPDGEGPRLAVLDSTHPATVAAYLETFPPPTSLYLVASKSGTTLETMSFFHAFWERAREAGGGDHFVAITDPDTELAALATAREFRRLVLAPPDVGGRFSALSQFGLVPATLLGADAAALLAGAAAMRDDPAEALDLGLLLGAAALGGRDKVTFRAPPPLMPFVAWLEQLLAESTGKEGSGLVPIAGEPQGAHWGEDRVFVRLSESGGADAARDSAELVAAGHPVVELEWPRRAALGAEMMRWEIATAVAAAVLGVQAFDQPDVDLAKRLARQAMTSSPPKADDPPLVEAADASALQAAMTRWLEGAAAGDYIAVQAFLPAAPDVNSTITRLRTDLAATGLPTTLGFGPRFLHSTGQLHKGGPSGVFCLQLIDRAGPDLAVPGSDLTFRRLIDAQALGDARALAARGRSVLRVRLGD
jgi:transaldolase / glucose-6-phosphate isomerase